jgi:hypothetical protein
LWVITRLILIRYAFNRYATIFQNFKRQKADEITEYAADQNELDEEDPDSVQNNTFDEMDADPLVGSGKTPAPHPSEIWAEEDFSDDDCVILDVYDPVPLSYASFVDPASANPGA